MADTGYSSVFRFSGSLASTLTKVAEDNEDEQEPTLLHDVTELSRSLIPSELFHKKKKMTSASSVATETKQKRGGLRRRLVASLGAGRDKRKEEKRDDVLEGEAQNVSLIPDETPESTQPRESRLDRKPFDRRSYAEQEKNRASEEDESVQDDVSAKSKVKKESGLVRRMRSLSRSRSRSNSRKDDSENRSGMIVAVTSCRSDGYYNQKAPGSTSKLPRKAPTNLKLFHELAVGVKDAYAAVGQTPQKPFEGEGAEKMTQQEFVAKAVLWEFIGNVDFVSSSHQLGLPPSALECCC